MTDFYNLDGVPASGQCWPYAAAGQRDECVGRGSGWCRRNDGQADCGRAGSVSVGVFFSNGYYISFLVVERMCVCGGGGGESLFSGMPVS